MISFMSSDLHTVLGAGPVGRATATELLAMGHRVRVVSRSGRGPGGEGLEGVERLAVDVTDGGRLASAAAGSRVLYNCLNPSQYHRWPQLWPPMHHALLAAAAQTGAVLATVSNLYAYGRPAGPMRESDPDRPVEAKGEVRARMWAEALAAHEAGRLRALEVRASDYVGPGVGAAGHLTRVLPRALQGRAVRVIGDPDMPHTWTDVTDVARALVRLAGDERAWGQVWHAPSNPPRTQREAITDVLAAGGREPVPVRGLPRSALAAVGLVHPLLRELRAVEYQFREPFVMDSSRVAETFGLAATPWPQVCVRTIEGARA